MCMDNFLALNSGPEQLFSFSLVEAFVCDIYVCVLDFFPFTRSPHEHQPIMWLWAYPKRNWTLAKMFHHQQHNSNMVCISGSFTDELYTIFFLYACIYLTPVAIILRSLGFEWCTSKIHKFAYHIVITCVEMTKGSHPSMWMCAEFSSFLFHIGDHLLWQCDFFFLLLHLNLHCKWLHHVLLCVCVAFYIHWKRASVLMCFIRINLIKKKIALNWCN